MIRPLPKIRKKIPLKERKIGWKGVVLTTCIALGIGVLLPKPEKTEQPPEQVYIDEIPLFTSTSPQTLPSEHNDLLEFRMRKAPHIKAWENIFFETKKDTMLWVDLKTGKLIMYEPSAQYQEMKKSKRRRALYKRLKFLEDSLDTKLSYAVRDNKTLLKGGIERMNRWKPYLLSIVEKHNLPEYVLNLTLSENFFTTDRNHPYAESYANAHGPWQITDFIGKRTYGLINDEHNIIDERYDPLRSTEIACQYINDLKQEIMIFYAIEANKKLEKAKKYAKETNIEKNLFIDITPEEVREDLLTQVEIYRTCFKQFSNGKRDDLLNMLAINAYHSGIGNIRTMLRFAVAEHIEDPLEQYLWGLNGGPFPSNNFKSQSKNYIVKLLALENTEHKITNAHSFPHSFDEVILEYRETDEGNNNGIRPHEIMEKIRINEWIFRGLNPAIHADAFKEQHDLHGLSSGYTLRLPTGLGEIFVQHFNEQLKKGASTKVAYYQSIDFLPEESTYAVALIDAFDHLSK